MGQTLGCCTDWNFSHLDSTDSHSQVNVNLNIFDAFEFEETECYRLCGISILPEEGAGWFPGDELKEFYGLGEYEDSKMESLILGHSSDGSEGTFCKTIPPFVKRNGADGKGNGVKSTINSDEDEEVGICITAAAENK